LNRKILKSTTDKFEIMRKLKTIFNLNNINIKFNDVIESLNSDIFKSHGLKTIIFLTSSDNKNFRLTDSLKINLRFMRNHDIKMISVNFNKETNSYLEEWSRYFNNAYYQFPEINVNDIINQYKNFITGNYTIFYKSNVSSEYNNVWVNQFITLSYLLNYSELNSGFYLGY
jgi:hypothetical protein